MSIKSIYIASRLFNPFDRWVSLCICESLERISSSGEADFYLPYRDSNLKVSESGNTANNIFMADIVQLQKTDLIVGRLEGMAYDSGVAFEIGLGYGYGIPLALFSSDYYYMMINSASYCFSRVLDNIALCYKYEYKASEQLSYKENLQLNMDGFVTFVTDNVKTLMLLDRRRTANGNQTADKKKKDKGKVYVDFFGLKYEWARVMSHKLQCGLLQEGIESNIADRSDIEYSVNDDIDSLRSADIAVFCLDGVEPDVDSSIMQGMAYAYGKIIIGYETQNEIRYVEGKQHMGVNLMNEQSCDNIAKSILELVSLIKSYIST